MDLFELLFELFNRLKTLTSDKAVAREAEVIILRDAQSRAIVKNVLKIRRVKQPLVRQIMVEIAETNETGIHTSSIKFGNASNRGGYRITH